jgi:hypothetical protein
LKETVDYEVGPEALVPVEEAAAAMETAARCVDAVTRLLAE